MFTQLALQFNRNPQLDDDQGFDQVATAKCPFDSSHIMQPKNLITHINRCKSPNKHLYVQCRYDPCHWIYPQQLQQHYQQCPTRKQYYADLDLNEGDWTQEEMMIKIQQRIQKEKVNKRKRKLMKIITVLKLKKKLKKASSKQEYQHLSKSLTQELSCFKSKQKNADKRQQKLYEAQITTKNQTSQYLSSPNMTKKPNNQVNLQSKLPPNHLNYSGRPYYSNYQEHPLGNNINAIQQFTYLPPYFLPEYPPNYYLPLNQQSQYQQPLHQQFQYQQQPNFQMNHCPPNLNHTNNFYWQTFQNQYSPMISKKPQPQKDLKFSQIADTQYFIKKKHKQHFTQKQNISLLHSTENLNNSHAQNLYAKNYAVNSQSKIFQPFTNYNGKEYLQKQNDHKNYYHAIDNYSSINSKNNVYFGATDDQKRGNQKQYEANQKIRNRKKQAKNQQNSDGHGQNSKTDKKKKYKQSSNKKSKKNKDKKDIQQKGYSYEAKNQNVYVKKNEKNSKQEEKGQMKHKNLRDDKITISNKILNSSIGNKVLNSSISGYDFIPFDVHPILNTTIMDSLIENGEQSQFLEMKQILEVLEQKTHKQMLYLDHRKMENETQNKKDKSDFK